MLDFTTPGKIGIGSVISVAGGGGQPPRSKSGSSGGGGVSSLSFHESGKWLFAASSSSNSLHVIDCLQGCRSQTHPYALRLEQETIDLVHATHHEHCVLFTGSSETTTSSSSSSSSMQKHAISYMSIHDNKILRKFRGHTGRIACLSQSPCEDTFLSSSADGTVRLWTLQSSGCLAECILPRENNNNNNNAATTAPLAVFDSTGLVFGITAPRGEPNNDGGGGGHYLHLYDARNHTAGAFAELTISQADLATAIQNAASSLPSSGANPLSNTTATTTTTSMMMTADRASYLAQQPFTSMQFNASGNQILVNSSMGGVSILLDGFEGTVHKALISCRNNHRNNNTAAVSCFSGDDSHVLTGNDNGTIDCWHVESGSIVQRLDTGVPGGNVANVAFNPTFSQFACSVSNDVALWIWR